MTGENYPFATCNSCGHHAPASEFGEIENGSSGSCPCCGSKHTMFCDEPTREDYLANRERVVVEMTRRLRTKVSEGLETKEETQDLIRILRKGYLHGIYTRAERAARRTRKPARRSTAVQIKPRPGTSNPARKSRKKAV